MNKLFSRTLIIGLVLLIFSKEILLAQQYCGLSGYIHVPSAEMDKEGDARIGFHYLNKQLLPNRGSFIYEGEKFNSASFYLALTPFKWVQVSYMMAFEKKMDEGYSKPSYSRKDRSFSLKFCPLFEKKYIPALAFGSQDILSPALDKKKGGLFGNLFIAITKHIKFHNHIFGATICYRRWGLVENYRWNGLIGGITYSPSFAHNFRILAEWSGDALNFGAEVLLLRHLLLQGSLTNGLNPSLGICYRVNLL